MPLQMLHVAGQVGEQRPHLPTPLGLQEEALVVAEGRRKRSLVRQGWSGPVGPSAGVRICLPLSGLEAFPPALTSPRSPPALTLLHLTSIWP